MITNVTPAKPTNDVTTSAMVIFSPSKIAPRMTVTMGSRFMMIDTTTIGRYLVL